MPLKLNKKAIVECTNLFDPASIRGIDDPNDRGLVQLFFIFEIGNEPDLVLRLQHIYILDDFCCRFDLILS